LNAKIFVLKSFIAHGKSTLGDRVFLEETQKLKKTLDTLRELGEDWRKNIAIINDATRGYEAGLESIKRLCKKNNSGNMVKLGLMLIAFPLPIVIDDVLGCSLLAAGLIQKKIKNSALYIEDVNKTFPHLMKELQETKKEII
jgi:hypothetical protein